MSRPDRNALGAALRRLYVLASAPGRLMEQLADADEIQSAFDPTLDALPLLHERIGTALWAGTGLEASIARSLARVGVAAPVPVPVSPVVARPPGRVSRNAAVPAASRARVAALLDETAAVEHAPASPGADAGAREQLTPGSRARGAALVSTQSAAAGRAAPRPVGAPDAAGVRTQPGDPALRPARARRAWMAAQPGGAAAGALAARQAEESASHGRASAPHGSVSEALARAPALYDRTPESHDRALALPDRASGNDRALAPHVSPRRLSMDAARARWQRAAERAGVAPALARPVTAGSHPGVPGVTDRASPAPSNVDAESPAPSNVDAESPAPSNVDAEVHSVADPAARAARAALISALFSDGAIAELDAPAGLAPGPGATARRLASALSRLAHARRGSQRAGAAGPSGPAEWVASAPVAPFAGSQAHAGPEPFSGPEPVASPHAFTEPPALSGLSGLRRMAALAGVGPASSALPGSDTAPAWTPPSPAQATAGARLPVPAAAPAALQPGSREDRALADRIADILRREAARHGIDVERDEP